MRVWRSLTGVLVGLFLGLLPVAADNALPQENAVAGPVPLALEGCWVFAFDGGVKSICIEPGGRRVRYNHNADFGVCSTIGTVEVSGGSLLMNLYRNETGCLGHTPQNETEYRCVMELPERLRCNPRAFRRDGGTNVLPVEIYRRP